MNLTTGSPSTDSAAEIMLQQLPRLCRLSIELAFVRTTADGLPTAVPFPAPSCRLRPSAIHALACFSSVPHVFQASRTHCLRQCRLSLGLCSVQAVAQWASGVNARSASRQARSNGVHLLRPQAQRFVQAPAPMRDRPNSPCPARPKIISRSLWVSKVFLQHPNRGSSSPTIRFLGTLYIGKERFAENTDRTGKINLIGRVSTPSVFPVDQAERKCGYALMHHGQCGSAQTNPVGFVGIKRSRFLAVQHSQWSRPCPRPCLDTGRSDRRPGSE